MPEGSETWKSDFKPTTVERFELEKEIWAVPCQDPNSPQSDDRRGWGSLMDDSLLRCEEKYKPSSRPPDTHLAPFQPSFSAGISPPCRRQSPPSTFVRGTLHSASLPTSHRPRAQRLIQDRVPRSLRYCTRLSPPHSPLGIPNRLSVLHPFFVTFNVQNRKRRPSMVAYIKFNSKNKLKK